MAVFIKREYDYAIRICAYLGAYYDDGLKSVSQISKKLLITLPFATKIVHQLKKKNLIDTVQGKYGGIRLKRSPQNVSIFDVLHAVGFDSSINECIRIPGICPLSATCKIHRFFNEQETKLIEALKNAKIYDFAIYDEDLAEIGFH
jgi:Rrf2 family nitric oxide-sensitive transcriptional repressor